MMKEFFHFFPFFPRFSYSTMLRLPRLVNAHALKGCARQNAVKGVHMRNYSMLNAKSGKSVQAQYQMRA